MCLCHVTKHGATAILHLCPEAPAWMWARSTDGQITLDNLVPAPPEPPQTPTPRKESTHSMATTTPAPSPVLTQEMVERRLARERAVPAPASQVPASPVTPAPAAKKRKTPEWKEQRHEIVYCDQCRRQLKAGEYTTTAEDVVATDWGRMVITQSTCHAHKATVARRAEFVVPARKRKGQPA